MAYMELVENYENLVKSMVPMECMEPVISGVWDITTTRSNTFRKVLKCLRVKYILHFIRV